MTGLQKQYLGLEPIALLTDPSKPRETVLKYSQIARLTSVEGRRESTGLTRLSDVCGLSIPNLSGTGIP